MASNSGQVTITLTSYELYLALVILGVAAGILGFVTHTIPSWVGYAGVTASLIVIFGMLADEFIPASAGEYVVITIVAAVVGEVGQLTGVQNVDLVAVLTWLVAILGAIYNSVTQQGGSFLNSQQSTLFLGITGAALSFFTWWLSNPTATTAALVATLVATIGQFIRVSVNSAALARKFPTQVTVPH